MKQQVEKTEETPRERYKSGVLVDIGTPSTYLPSTLTESWPARKVGEVRLAQHKAPAAPHGIHSLARPVGWGRRSAGRVGGSRAS